MVKFPLNEREIRLRDYISGVIEKYFPGKLIFECNPHGGDYIHKDILRSMDVVYCSIQNVKDPTNAKFTRYRRSFFFEPVWIDKLKSVGWTEEFILKMVELDRRRAVIEWCKFVIMAIDNDNVVPNPECDYFEPWEYRLWDAWSVQADHLQIPCWHSNLRNVDIPRCGRQIILINERR